jgi:hypothetical protein
MTAPILLLALSAGTALLALLLSLITRGPLPRRLARASLWLAVAAIPASLIWDLLLPSSTQPEATQLTTVVEHLKSYGSLAFPCAGLAMLAIRRTTRTTLRRP